ncbi:hypothetical protein AGABI2DRAFT_192562, partial [Agaricus bisporus var. bisporus H97]|uniref:hypothetical protein n=1 Tax=Agaricus bisporus var. bisporus (strain H97 / ATCC MYA-4626 / FGSC 10389) TaxID=936046 RepID=UPI00029F5BC4
MTIWSCDNHPWFDYSGKKRKHGLRELSTSSDESDTMGEGRVAKRARRDSALEQGFADLSLLSNPVVGREEEGPMVIELPREDGMDDGAMLPSTVEEPGQEIPEVQMKTSSWYEIDSHRLVITDLDSFASEDEEGSSGITINADLLKHFKDQPPLVPRELLGPSPESQALVLFRPLPIQNLEASE